MPRKGGGEGKYRSLKSGRYVSAYYAKRHPQTTYKVGSEEEGDDPRQEIPEHQEPRSVRSPQKKRRKQAKSGPDS